MSDFAILPLGTQSQVQPEPNVSYQLTNNLEEPQPWWLMEEYFTDEQKAQILGAGGLLFHKDNMAPYYQWYAANVVDAEMR